MRFFFDFKESKMIKICQANDEIWIIAKENQPFDQVFRVVTDRYFRRKYKGLSPMNDFVVRFRRSVRTKRGISCAKHTLSPKKDFFSK